ncbi:hypothetical protein HOG21_04375 [bacterium]|nr:hypothetical protein [bacterium]
MNTINHSVNIYGNVHPCINQIQNNQTVVNIAFTKAIVACAFIINPNDFTIFSNIILYSLYKKLKLDFFIQSKYFFILNLSNKKTKLSIRDNSPCKNITDADFTLSNISRITAIS